MGNANEQKHTHTPWRSKGRRFYAGKTLIGTIDGGYRNDEADARRIVACVNACEGLNIELIEAIASIDHPIARIAALAQSTDDIGQKSLLAIIETKGEQVADAVIAEANAALDRFSAKATGQPRPLPEQSRAEVLRAAAPG